MDLVDRLVAWTCLFGLTGVYLMMAWHFLPELFRWREWAMAGLLVAGGLVLAGIWWALLP